MTRLFALTALILFFLLPAAAGAQQPASEGAPQPAVSFTEEPAPAEWQALMVPAAEAWGGQQPTCPQGVTMSIMDDPADNAARAVLGGCRIWVNRPQLTAPVSWLNRCKAIAHEWGHLLGHDHEPGGLMDAGPASYDAPVPACERRYPDPAAPVVQDVPPTPLLRVSCKQARRIVLDELGRGWKLTRSCTGGPLRKRLIARSRRHPHVSERFYVTRPDRFSSEVDTVRVDGRARPTA